MKDLDQDKFQKAKFSKSFNKDVTKARYEEEKNKKTREFVPQHENLIEIKIKQAIHDGKFDNLPGKGKPIDLDKTTTIPEHLRTGYHALKNSGFLPEEVRLKKEMESLRNEIKNCRNDDELKKKKKQLVDVSNKFHFYMDYNKSLK